MPKVITTVIEKSGCVQINHSKYLPNKKKFTLLQAIKAQRWSKNIGLLFL
jgi:hypothetical protein